MIAKTLIFIILASLMIVGVNGQSIWLTGNQTSSRLSFLTHRDSIPNLYEIKYGIAIIKGDTFKLADSISNPEYIDRSWPYKHYMSSYLSYSSTNNTKLYRELDFCYDRLYSVMIFTNDTSIISKFKQEIKLGSWDRVSIGTSDDWWDKGKITGMTGLNNRTYVRFRLDRSTGFGYLWFEDRGIARRIPSWCGWGIDLRTWKGLKRYIDKKVNQMARQSK